MPFFFLQHFFAHPPRYPLSAREIPEGVVSFLKDVRAEGTLLNYPNTGGYLEWSLYPAVRIFMDMQVPFLFTDADFMAARGAFTDGQRLGQLIGRYRPTFISVPIDMTGFELIHPDYRVIFRHGSFYDNARSDRLDGAHNLHGVDPSHYMKTVSGLRSPVLLSRNYSSSDNGIPRAGLSMPPSRPRIRGKGATLTHSSSQSPSYVPTRSRTWAIS
jgi:hypothetical protein